MRHKWEKIKGRIDGVMIGDGLVTNPFECVQCGLRKGTVKKTMKTMRVFPRLVYFRDKKILSTDRIPSACYPIEENKYFLSINDFMLD